MARTVNMGGLDRSLRIAAGLVLVGLAAAGTIGWWGWVGLFPLVTGIAGWCPLYADLGIDSCERVAEGGPG